MRRALCWFMTPTELTSLAEQMTDRDAYFESFRATKDTQDGEPVIQVIFALSPVEAPTILGYTPDPEEWLEEED